MSKGLANVVAGDTAISTVGLGTGLNYRGFSVNDLSQHCSFEQVTHLLLYKTLPTKSQLCNLKKKINQYRTLDQKLIKVLQLIPS